MGCNLLCERVLAAGYICPNLIQSHHCQRRYNGWVNPHPVRLAFWAHARHPPCRPVVKPHKGLIQPRGQEAFLLPKQEHHLNHRHIKPPRRSIISSLPSQDLCQPSSFYLRPPEVPFHLRPIVASGQQRSYQVP